MSFPALRDNNFRHFHLINLFVAILATMTLFAPASLQAGAPLPLGYLSLFTDQPEGTQAVQPVNEQHMELLESPRATMEHFLDSVKSGHVEAATDCFDLPMPTKNQIGPAAVFKLASIISHLGRPEPKKLPTDKDYDQSVSLAKCISGLSNEARLTASAITISRGENGLWRFDRKTVSKLDDLYRLWRDKPPVIEEMSVSAERPISVQLEELFPDTLLTKHVMLPDYQWICLLVVVFLGLLADLITRLVLHHVTRAWFQFFRAKKDRVIDFKIWRPVGLLVQACVWYLGTTVIGLPPFILQILLVGLKVFAVTAFIWTAFAGINVLGLYLEMRAKKSDTKFDDLLTPLITKTLKVMVSVIGVIMCAEVFDLPIAGLLGGLGVGGVALAIASKDAVSNLFGSVTVLVDRPFEIGDWVILPNAEGTVETVGFRSTRIRTFYNSQVTVPNCLLTTAIVDNMGRRQKRRVKTTLGVEYNTPPEKIAAFCEGIRELVKQHPHGVNEGIMVYLNQFSENSLDIMLYFFLEVPDWDTELADRHQLFSDIITLAHKMGIGFAFPTRTLHMFQEEHAPPSPTMTPEDGRRMAVDLALAYRGIQPTPPPEPEEDPERLESDSADSDNHGGADGDGEGQQ